MSVKVAAVGSCGPACDTTMIACVVRCCKVSLASVVGYLTATHRSIHGEHADLVGVGQLWWVMYLVNFGLSSSSSYGVE